MKNKSTTTKTARKGPHATPLGSYLSITAGAGAASLLSANGSLVTYNGAAVTATVGQTLYWNPITMTAGVYDSSTPGNFELRYGDANYIYSQGNYGAIDMFFGVQPEGVTAKFSAGATIGVGTTWTKNCTYMNKSGWTTADSPWATGQNGTTGYIPFKFWYHTIPVNYYGWADITYNPVAGSIVLNNFAYNNTPGASITTPVSPVPEVTSSFTLLGLITGGLMMRRRRGNQAAVAVAS